MGEPIGPIENGTTYMSAAAHAAVEQLNQARLHFRGIDPVVGGPGVGAVHAAYEGAVLDARDIAGVGARKKAPGTLARIEC